MPDWHYCLYYRPRKTGGVCVVLLATLALQVISELSSLRMLRDLVAAEEEEAQIMGGVPGWKVGESLYHTDKWIPLHPSQLKPH